MMRRDVEFGTLMAQTFANLRIIWWQVLAYLAVVTVLAFAVPLVGAETGGVGGLLLYFAGQYWLYRALLKARGLVEVPRIHYFRFVGLAVVLIFPIMFGLALLVVPGLFLIARYIAAPAFIVAGGDGVFAAAISSWQAVHGHTGKLMGAVALLFMLVSVIGTLTSGFGAMFLDSGAFPEVRTIDVIEAHLFPLLLLGLSCATYELLGPKDDSIEEVFG